MLKKLQAKSPISAPGLAYTFRGAQSEIQADTSDEIVLSGPAGTGKSLASLYKLHHAAMRYPRSRWLVLRKTRASLTDSALVTYEDRILGPDNPILAGGLRENRHSYKYPNGSEVVLGGMDKPTRLFSTEYDGIYVQECNELTLGEWESLLRALRGDATPHQQLFGDCNPDSPRHWLKQRADGGRCNLYYTRHEDNPALWTGSTWTARGMSYIAKLDRLTGLRYQRLRLGKWAAAEGMVYEFDPAVHLLDPFVIPAEWQRIRSIDFGFTNPFVCQWWAIDPDGRMYLYREIYKTQRIVSDHAVQIKALSAGERIRGSVSDHDAEDRETLHRAGISTTPAKKEVKLGIEAVEKRLRVQADGKPRLFVLRNALVERDEQLAEDVKPTCTEQEFDSYVYAKSVDGKANKEEPVKMYDHGLDAARYAVRFVDSGGSQGVFL